MDIRYVIIAGNVILVSSLFILIGYATGNSTIMGVSFSSLVLGLVILNIGLTYSEPLRLLYQEYSYDLTSAVVKLLEDLNMVEDHVVVACSVPSGVMLVFARGIVPCEKIVPGIGIVDGIAYFAFPIRSLGAISSSVLESLEEGGERGINIIREGLRDLLVGKYGVCRDIIVEKKENNSFRVTLVGVHPGLHELAKHPLNPIKLLIPVLLLGFLAPRVVVTGEEVIEDEYSLVLEKLQAS